MENINDKLSQQTINDIVWRACDTFRGVIDGNDYKNYILVMLFIKYISDVWQYKKEQLGRKYPGNKNRVERKLKAETFTLPAGHSFEDLYNKRQVDNIGEEIDISIHAVEEANREKLEGVFRGINFNSDKIGEIRERNVLLRHLLEDFADPRLNLRPDNIGEDVIGEAYMYLIERFGGEAGKKAGEFYTPATVRRLIAQLAQARKSAEIYDPACGSASLLIDTAQAIGGEDFALHGQENNEATVALAKMNVLLHSQYAADIRRGDTLRAPRFIDGNHIKRFDIVVANPPFSLDKWGAQEVEDDRYNRFWRGIPPKSKADWAFICHMLELAKPQSGRVVVVVPHGVLFRGAAEGKIRRQVIEENLLDTVIGLPANLFSTTGIPVALLLFDKRREKGGELEKRKNVLFIDASKHYEAKRNRNELREADIKRILTTAQKRQTADKYARVSTAKEIAENDYNLNIPRYVDTFQEEEPIDIKAVQKEIGQLEKELDNVRKEMSSVMKKMMR
ncbi:MAG: type I restriction-modification system subunit M [Candidatus Zeuxoniibacter abyssi]|nr:MAG: type I restriction-modification system subunit M [Candidatus Persebacteraceae bacterium AB1(2)]